MSPAPALPDVLADLAAHFDAMADAAELTIGALGNLDAPATGADLRALSARYAAGRRDAYRGAAESIREAAENLVDPAELGDLGLGGLG